jgi:NADH:ubiquinone oxidoreductase subunit E
MVASRSNIIWGLRFIDQMLVHIKVCSGRNCIALGNYEILDYLESQPDLMEFCRVVATPCQERCEGGGHSPVVFVNDVIITNATTQEVLEEIERQRAAADPGGN